MRQFGFITCSMFLSELDKHSMYQVHFSLPFPIEFNFNNSKTSFTVLIFLTEWMFGIKVIEILNTKKVSMSRVNTGIKASKVRNSNGDFCTIFSNSIYFLYNE